MEQVGLRELNQHASRVIERVKLGEVIEITERGRPVARVIPIPSGNEWLDRMVREGRVIPATGDGRFSPQRAGDPNVSLSDVLVGMREEGRY